MWSQKQMQGLLLQLARKCLLYDHPWTKIKDNSLSMSLGATLHNVLVA